MVRGKDICMANWAIFGSITVWHCLLKFSFTSIYIYNSNILYFYLIPWVLVSTFKSLWTHGYLRITWLTDPSMAIRKLKTCWIQITHECTHAQPYTIYRTHFMYILFMLYYSKYYPLRSLWSAGRTRATALTPKALTGMCGVRNVTLQCNQNAFSKWVNITL